MGTKSNPSCYHGALELFSNITGISKTKEIYFQKLEHIRTQPNKNRNSSYKFKSKLKYSADRIKIETECGKTVSYFPFPNVRFDKIYEAKRIIVTINRVLQDFGLEYEHVGNYKESLGGGWHTDTPLYRYKDFYFAYLDCAHS